MAKRRWIIEYASIVRVTSSSRPFFFPSTQNFEILSFRATLLFFPSMAYAPCCVRAPGGNLGKGNLIYNDACLSRTVRWTHSSTQ